MLRTSLSDRRRIAENVSRWCGASSNSRQCHYVQMKRTHHYQLSCKTVHTTSDRFGVSNYSPQRAIAASMSTKPSFDNIYEDEDEVDNSDEYQLKWVKQAPLDNFSKYDNFVQYDSNNGGGSLLDLINKEDDAPAIKKQLDRVESSMMMLLNEDTGELLDVENMTQYSRTESGDESLLELLDAPDIYQDEEPLSELLDEETKDDTQSEKYKDLQRLQLQLEIESTQEAVERYMLELKSARARSDHASLPGIRRALGSWYEELTDAIELEQWLYLNGDNKTSTESQFNLDESGEGTKPKTVKDRTIYGPLLCLIPARKIAVLVAHTALSCTVQDQEMGSKVVSLAMNIAQAMEAEVNVSRALRVRARERRAFNSDIKATTSEIDDNGHMLNDQSTIDGSLENEEVDLSSEGIAVDRWVYTATHLQRFLDEISRKGGSGGQQSLKGAGRVKPAVVRKRCQDILLSEGFDPTGENKKPLSMEDFVEWDPVLKVKLGASLIRLLLDHTTFSSDSNRGSPPEPAFSYARKKTGEMKFNGFVSIHPELLHLATTDEISSDSTFIPPRAMANTKCQPMVVPPKDWTDVKGGGYEILKVDFMRTRHCKTQKDAIRNADLSTVFKGLNMLGNIPWAINHKVLDAAEKCWEDGISLGDIPSRVDFEVPPLPEPMNYVDYHSLSEEEQKLHIEAFKKHKDATTKHLRFKQKNMDLHSLRCSAMLKLNQAKKFKDFEEVFFPYNVDFRGRAYPVPPHLSIVGSDLCRALLTFATPKPLGPNGLKWLKVHLANLAGADKMSFEGRAQFTEDNMDNVRAAVDDPFGENNWWMKLDDPFQGLATCHEIINAIDSGDPENYLCSLPVHMDGSCNGLQHYAALGRDRDGGKAVNLCIADEPQDVYIGVMHEVIRRVAEDANEMLDFVDENSSDLTKKEKALLKKAKSARLVNGLIDRGVVKRTVMTSVYGVTYIGARNQIEEKIEEKLEDKGHDIDEIESEINTSCGYLASLTMEVMGQKFKGARDTMDWLTACARLIAAQGQPVAFISPIGVPVVQPYRQKRPFTVVTLLQNVVLTNDSDMLPVHRQRQVSAFPPNYVHSLDSSHMILTAIEMQKRGLYFSAVHDSYWTHPCDIEEMNAILRESFINLYNQPLLQDLKKMWELRYPSIIFPDCPELGDLDLDDVRSAPYFFQ
eukprot:CAMPEP_0113419448 /NCGR_PEP_ID=MMETSP0013_2-20120614/26785_1 /TAXON_ID=2843 ORGANISM="Skeletonema costatum, Strain 1716" /NCGR_SAMPLE_ID=MMETSP0013_2 /ASSEMBLY_ACC=CAM_ASM_000158 /LENGTH=1175 /DNA_ID=CAMNT_0000306831 /DNA_START=111 /DNA_END=3638 /DNA_ORIENTATION=+ /assembly_acc=CAM_ASM_000158